MTCNNRDCHCGKQKSSEQNGTFMCTRKKCLYVVLYPSRYYQGKNEEFKDSVCDERKCFYFSYPYRYLQTNRPTVTGVLQDSDF